MSGAVETDSDSEENEKIFPLIEVGINTEKYIQENIIPKIVVDNNSLWDDSNLVEHREIAFVREFKPNVERLINLAMNFYHYTLPSWRLDEVEANESTDSVAYKCVLSARQKQLYSKGKTLLDSFPLALWTVNDNWKATVTCQKGMVYMATPTADGCQLNVVKKDEVIALKIQVPYLFVVGCNTWIAFKLDSKKEVEKRQMKKMIRQMKKMIQNCNS